MRLLSDDNRRDRYDKERIVHEIVDDPDVYNIGDGPEGPWLFKSLTVKRIYNTIYVYDVDAKLVDKFGVDDIIGDDADEIYDNLHERLARIHEESLSAL